MTYVISIILIIVAMELLMKFIINKKEMKRLLESRKETLSKSLEHDFSQISVSLKRVELQNPTARLLIVDRDEQVLDKLRSMLVMDGYSVDTVTSGNEAISLTLLNHYDFVFSGEHSKDLSGDELSKKVIERRPDMNVVMITESVGASTPYDLIREGAIDFIQKPYVDSQLNDFVRTQLKQRRDKIKKTLKSSFRAKQSAEYIPNGLFLSKNHIWVSVEQDGILRIGIDKFASDVLGVIDTVDFANLNITISKENPLFIMKKNYTDIPFISPINGRVVSANVKLRDNFRLLSEDPYKNWLCCVEPDIIGEALSSLMIGGQANDYIKNEYARLIDIARQNSIPINSDEPNFHELQSEQWQIIISSSFGK